MAQTFLFFMPISQESLLLISMPGSAITVCQVHIPSKTHFQKLLNFILQTVWIQIRQLS